MASLDQVKEIFSKTDFEVARGGDDSRFTLKLWDTEYFILTSEADEYIAVKNALLLGPETAIFSPGYFEHLIEVSRGLFRLRRIFDVKTGLIGISNPDNSLAAKVGVCSMPFFLKMMQSTEFARLKRYVVTFIGDDASSIKEPAHVSEAFQRMYTIRLIGSETLAYRNERIKLRKIAEAVLFNLSFGSGTSLNLKTSWERETYRFAERRNEIVQFPKRTYETDLLSYYHLALSTDSLILRYISLYKILEFFFSSSAEQELHARMTERLISPDFSHSKPEQLRQLTTVVRKHDQRMDEQRMLSTVIERFFPPDEIIAWLNSLDENSRQSYIGATPIFGEICSVDTNPESLASSLAKRIYHIRNVLVHNKEGELPRFIPFSGQEAILLKEMPLLVFLAERVILKTGKDL